MSSSPPCSDQSDGNNNTGTPDSSTNCITKLNVKSSLNKKETNTNRKTNTKQIPMVVTTNSPSSVLSTNIPMLKRANKPLMEKRRRARINQSLALLKALILDSAKTENTKHSKLEKADILELTVRHLQRQKILSSDIRSKYKAGYEECTKEVSRFFETPELHLGLSTTSNTGKSNSKSSSVAIATLMSGEPVIDLAVKQRLFRHLENCMSEIDLDFSASAEKLGINHDFSSEDDLFHMVKTRAEPDSSTTTLPINLNLTKVSPIVNSNLNSTGRRKYKTKIQKNNATPCDLTTDSNSNTSSNTVENPLSVLQVIPSRLPDGQVVFILPSHYVQVDKDDLKNPVSPSCYDQPLDFSLKRDDSMWRPW